MTYYQVEFFHVKNGRHATDRIVTEAELNENPTFEEEQKAFLPAIKNYIGHSNVKLLSYKKL